MRRVKDEPFRRSFGQPVSASWIASQLSTSNYEIIGDPATTADSIAYLTDDVPGSLSFWDSDGIDPINSSRASIVFIRERIETMPGRAFICVSDPRWFFIEITALLFADTASGAHPTVVTGDNVTLPESVKVGANAYIGDNVIIGENSRIGNNCIVHSDTFIGSHTWIKDACVIGSHGLSFHRNEEGELARFPHLGATIIDDHVEVGTGSCVVRGMLSDTWIGSRTKIGNLVNIGHGSQIDVDCWISAGSNIGGHSTLGSRVMTGMSVTIANNINVDDNVRIGMGSVVTKDVEPGTKLFGNPARPLRTLKPFGPTPRSPLSNTH